MLLCTYMWFHVTFCDTQLSFDLSEYTANVDGVGTLRLLDAIRTAGLEKTVKFYQVSLGYIKCGYVLTLYVYLLIHRHQLVNYLVRYRRYHRRKPHLSILALRMELQNSMLIGLLWIIGKIHYLVLVNALNYS